MGINDGSGSGGDWVPACAEMTGHSGDDATTADGERLSWRHGFRWLWLGVVMFCIGVFAFFKIK